MRITFIGCGDAFSQKLGNNSAILEFENTNLLIDIPDSNYGKIDYSDVKNIFITHLHGDHINGLERFAYYKKFATPVLRPGEKIEKTNIFIPETIYHGLWDSVKNGLGITADGIKSLDDYFNVHIIKITDQSGSIMQGIDGIGEFTIENTVFNITPSKHVPNMPVYGLFVKNEFYYSADSVYNEEAIPYYLSNTKKIFHDTHFFEGKIAVHASIRDFKYLSNEKKEKIYAMHYDDSRVDTDKVDGIKLVKPLVSIEI
jgi:ribonuclease BN (tRNA processing enzyme)